MTTVAGDLGDPYEVCSVLSTENHGDVRSAASGVAARMSRTPYSGITAAVPENQRAEGVGFEPTMTVTSHSGFQDRRHRPLGEPSQTAAQRRPRLPTRAGAGPLVLPRHPGAP